MLRLEVLRPVLADDLDPGLGEHGHLLERDVLRGGDDGDPRADLVPDPLVALADLVRRQRDHALAAGQAAVAPVGEEEVRVAERAEVGALDLRDARRAQRPLGRAPEVELAVLDDLGPKRPSNGSATSGPTS